MRISHVAIWIGDGKFIHASQVVRISTLDDYSRKPVCIRRVLGSVGKPGVKVVEPASSSAGLSAPAAPANAEASALPLPGGGNACRGLVFRSHSPCLYARYSQQYPNQKESPSR